MLGVTVVKFFGVNRRLYIHQRKLKFWLPTCRNVDIETDVHKIGFLYKLSIM